MNIIRTILKWAETHGVPLNHVTIRTNCYSFEPDRKEMAELAGIEIHACDITHTEIIFDHAYETAESFRTVKRAIIKPFEVMGDSGSFLQAPMILLQYSLDDEPLYLKVHWHGAYQCEPTTKYHCIPVGFPNDKDTTVETVD